MYSFNARFWTDLVKKRQFREMLWDPTASAFLVDTSLVQDNDDTDIHEHFFKKMEND